MTADKPVANMADHIPEVGKMVLVLVPVEPTPEMLATQGKSRPDLAKTEEQRRTAELLNSSIRKMAAETWREMLAAAPQSEVAAELSRLSAENADLLSRNSVLNADGIAARKAASNNLARALAAEARLSEAVEHIDQLCGLLEMIKEHWIDYDHVFSISVHEGRTFINSIKGETK